MKNQIYRAIAIFGIFFGLAVASVQAQTPSKVEVDIPFEFSAGKTTLKPGVYTIKRMSGNLLELRERRWQVVSDSECSGKPQLDDPEATERLVFNKYGDQYFLAQIWLTVDSGRQVFTGKETREA